MKQSLSFAATNRLEASGRKIYASALILLMVEVCIRQFLQRPHFNILSDVTLWVLVLSVLAVFASAWVGRANNLMLHLHSLVSLLAVLLLPAMRLGTLPDATHSEPWVWWTVGLGAVSSALIPWPSWVFKIYLPIISLAWLLVHMSELGGEASFLRALEDSFYVVFLAGGISGLVLLARSWAFRVDEASSKQIVSVIEKAKSDAVEREEQRIDALVHDSVLNTFILASVAKTDQEHQAVAALAGSAIEELEAMDGSELVAGHANTLGLFRALRKAARSAAPNIDISAHGGGLEMIPVLASQAIFGATLQAIDNAVKHSGSSELALKLNSPAPGELAILVIDKGIGFSLQKLPKNRVGIRGSILSRMELIGGSAKIKSSPNEGTTVSLRWPE
jgi:signal transduction histidine kinase